MHIDNRVSSLEAARKFLSEYECVTINTVRNLFVQKFIFDLPRKLSIFWGEKLVKMLWFWTF